MAVLTSERLRQDFPEFSDATQYPAPGVNFWLGVAAKMLNAERWADMLDVGQELFAAHHLTLERAAAVAAANGAPPGGDVGPVNNKSVDKVSVGYDTQAGIEIEAGHWNLTVYGTRFASLFRLMGAGPVQIGLPGPSDPGPAAYSGPWPWFFPNMNQ